MFCFLVYCILCLFEIIVRTSQGDGEPNPAKCSLSRINKTFQDSVLKRYWDSLSSVSDFNRWYLARAKFWISLVRTFHQKCMQKWGGGLPGSDPSQENLKFLGNFCEITKKTLRFVSTLPSSQEKNLAQAPAFVAHFLSMWWDLVTDEHKRLGILILMIHLDRSLRSRWSIGYLRQNFILKQMAGGGVGYFLLFTSHVPKYLHYLYSQFQSCLIYLPGYQVETPGELVPIGQCTKFQHGWRQY